MTEAPEERCKRCGGSGTNRNRTCGLCRGSGVVRPALSTPAGPVTEAERHVAALKSIANHGMINDNDASMVWTARVALNEIWLSSVPEHLRDVVASRFEGDGA